MTPPFSGMEVTAASSVGAPPVPGVVLPAPAAVGLGASRVYQANPAAPATTATPAPMMTARRDVECCSSPASGVAECLPASVWTTVASGEPYTPAGAHVEYGGGPPAAGRWPPGGGGPAAPVDCQGGWSGRPAACPGPAGHGG